MTTSVQRHCNNHDYTCIKSTSPNFHTVYFRSDGHIVEIEIGEDGSVNMKENDDSTMMTTVPGIYLLLNVENSENHAGHLD